MEDIYQNINEGVYKVKAPYPGQAFKPQVLGKGYEHLDKEAALIYQKLCDTRLKEMKIYRNEQSKQNDLFRRDALEYCDLADHPKADRAFGYAWDRGHSSGLYEVVQYLEEIAGILLD